ASLDSIFKAYDVRGLVPDQLDETLAHAIGAAFARFAAASPDGVGSGVLVARDMRPSGVELTQAFIRGVTEQGVDVTDLGLASTDLLYYASGRLDAAGAVFTASHNPAQYNGIKFCLAGAKPVGQDTGLDEIKNMAADPPPPADTPGTVRSQQLIDEYADHVIAFVDREVLRPLRVVADTANGMGGLVVPPVFDRLPFELEILYPELDGTFPNHPADPIQPENLRDLQERVLAVGADVGLAFDGDADRVFLVDEKAQPMSGSLTTAMVAAALLEKNPGATILYNLICSKSVPEVVSEKGGTPIKTRVGHSFIKARMAETGAVFGGEHSGHYYFLDNYRADSGLIAAVIVLELLSKADQPLSELRKPFERYAASGEINTIVDDPPAVIDRIAEHFSGQAEQDRMDGLTIDFGEWWFNLRPSNTEPLLRLNLEAPDQASCDAHVAEITDLIKEKG
ncbi:MAG: phosphomannomutase/phosphoglucomutase, partial [Actinobacteria bacterium]|nr:phosphomannomutase/phosphoglucomutase [Actinomycetota bacterium]